jgi:predicted nucleic acid-binding protein
MKATFADTFYFLALLNPKDQAHRKSLAARKSVSGQLVTTDYVLIEVGDALSHPAYRKRYLDLVSALRMDSQTDIVPASSDFLTKGLNLFAARPDKNWTLTDCLSFVIMSEREISEALTGDVHFRQAGFTVLLM